MRSDVPAEPEDAGSNPVRAHPGRLEAPMRRRNRVNGWIATRDCPECGSRLIAFHDQRGAFYGCTRRSACGFRISRDRAFEEMARQLGVLQNRLISLQNRVLDLEQDARPYTERMYGVRAPEAERDADLDF